MKWKELWPYAHTAWGWTVACITAVASVYYGPKTMLETYYWYMDYLWDHKVRSYLASQEIPAKLTGLGVIPATHVPCELTEITKAVGMSEPRVISSLKRLERKREVIPDHGKWKFSK